MASLNGTNATFDTFVRSYEIGRAGAHVGLGDELAVLPGRLAFRVVLKFQADEKRHRRRASRINRAPGCHRGFRWHQARRAARQRVISEGGMSLMCRYRPTRCPKLPACTVPSDLHSWEPGPGRLPVAAHYPGLARGGPALCVVVNHSDNTLQRDDFPAISMPRYCPEAQINSSRDADPSSAKRPIKLLASAAFEADSGKAWQRFWERPRTSPGLERARRGSRRLAASITGRHAATSPRAARNIGRGDCLRMRAQVHEQSIPREPEESATCAQGTPSRAGSASSEGIVMPTRRWRARTRHHAISHGPRFLWRRDRALEARNRCAASSSR